MLPGQHILRVWLCRRGRRSCPLSLGRGKGQGPLPEEDVSQVRNSRAPGRRVLSVLAEVTWGITRCGPDVRPSCRALLRSPPLRPMQCLSPSQFWSSTRRSAVLCPPGLSSLFKDSTLSLLLSWPLNWSCMSPIHPAHICQILLSGDQILLLIGALPCSIVLHDPRYSLYSAS